MTTQSALSQRITALEDRVASLEKAIAAKMGVSPTTDVLATRLTKVETWLSQASAGTNRSRFSP